MTQGPNHEDFLRDIAQTFTGLDVFVQRGLEKIELGHIHLAEVAAGDSSVIYLYFGHEPVAAPYPMNRVWARTQLQGAVRIDFLKQGEEPFLDLGIVPFPSPAPMPPRYVAKRFHTGGNGRIDEI